MRTARHTRYLGSLETDIARKVFQNTIPYDDVVVSDGLGMGDRPFTLPTDMPATLLFNVSDGKYVIHAGDGYFGMSRDKEDQKLLIHELTHVWQGEHSGSSWDYVFSSAWSQALLDDAYAYDKQRLKPWNDYNPEQQAHIVEDWFADGMREGEEEDRRFYYIQAHIRGQVVDHDWIRAQWVVKPLEAATLHIDLPGESPDRYLLPILKQRFGANDVSGFGGRVKKLEEFFSKLRAVDARELLRRLEARRHGDQVAHYFHDHLSPVTTNRLMGILRGK
jgi:hypothetical protein